MPAKVIKNLLVGIGYDVDKQSFDKAEGSIDLLGKKALQLGGILAGAFGAKALTVDFAKRADELGKFSEVMGLSADDVSAFGGAIEREAGSLSAFMTQIQNLQALRDGVATGTNTGWLGSAAQVGINPQPIIEAKDALAAYLEIADQLSKLAPEQQRAAAGVFGFDDASLRLLSKGREEVQAIVNHQKQIAPLTDEMTEAAEKFNDQMQTLNRNLESIANILGGVALDELNDFLGNVNGFFDDNRKPIHETAKEVGGVGGALVDKTMNMYGFLWEGAKGLNSGDFSGMSEYGFADIYWPAAVAFNAASYLDSLLEIPTPKGNSYSGAIDRSPQVIENKVFIDGQLIDSRIHKVNERNNQQAIEDISSGVD